MPSVVRFCKHVSCDGTIIVTDIVALDYLLDDIDSSAQAIIPVFKTLSIRTLGKRNPREFQKSRAMLETSQIALFCKER